MMFLPERSLCEKNQAIVVSKEKGEGREHRAINPKKEFDLRQYRLDGEIICQTTCCDFLLLNDTKKKAYLIELKGKKIDAAVKQLEAGEQKCKKELRGYEFQYRIVCSKAKTHKLQSSSFRKFKAKYGPRLKIKENYLEETLD